VVVVVGGEVVVVSGEVVVGEEVVDGPRETDCNALRALIRVLVMVNLSLPLMASPVLTIAALISSAVRSFL
jgi:hypothetical protein